MAIRKQSILIIDDKPANLLTLAVVLQSDFELRIATSGTMGLEQARQFPPDLILLDVMMPYLNGYETCRKLKADPSLQQIPVIFVTALTESEDEYAGLALGAVDYITKPINIAIAKRRICNLLERERLRQEIEAHRDHLAGLVLSRTEALVIAQEHGMHLQSIAYYDPLTGVPNRRLLMDRLNQALAHAQRSRLMLAIGYFDLDAFKPVNDQLGHAAGDQLLIEMTIRLQAILRHCDSLARFGGDEFVLLLGDIMHETECYDIVERVLAVIRLPFTIRNKTVVVSASLGITLYPQDTADANTLLIHADRAMYQAKQAGKDRFVVYNTQP